jgi:hypothetical protein
VGGALEFVELVEQQPPCGDPVIELGVTPGQLPRMPVRQL